MKLTFDNSDGELWFTTCRYDGSLIERRDPFSGKPIRVPRNTGLTKAEAARVRAILAEAKKRMKRLEIQDDDVANGCMVSSRNNSPTSLAVLLYDLLVAGDWCLQADDALIVASLSSIRGRPAADLPLPEGYPLPPERVVVVSSAANLAAELAG